jgi:hypothetical protein
MMANNEKMTAAELLRVRSAVADRLKVEGSQQQLSTRERIAERLLLGGYIDIDFVLESVTPSVDPDLMDEASEG